MNPLAPTFIPNHRDDFDTLGNRDESASHMHVLTSTAPRIPPTVLLNSSNLTEVLAETRVPSQFRKELQYSSDCISAETLFDQNEEEQIYGSRYFRQDNEVHRPKFPVAPRQTNRIGALQEELDAVKAKLELETRGRKLAHEDLTRLEGILKAVRLDLSSEKSARGVIEFHNNRLQAKLDFVNDQLELEKEAFREQSAATAKLEKELAELKADMESKRVTVHGQKTKKKRVDQKTAVSQTQDNAHRKRQ